MKNGLFLLVLTICFCSCIKEDVPPCPDQYRVQVYVKDKNYVNQQAVDNNSPFRQYVNTIYYILHNLETGTTTYSSLIHVTGNEKEYTIQFPNISSGRYILAILGNLPNSSAIVNDEINLNSPSTEASFDLYLVSDTISFTSEKQSNSVGLERTKGKLQITCKNFPDSISNVDIKVTNLYQYLRSDYTYSRTTDVMKSFPLTGAEDLVLETILAPTVAGSTSELTLSIFANNNNLPLFTPATINMNIKRNEVINIEINYNNLSMMWEIWIQINSQWERVYQMDIFPI